MPNLRIPVKVDRLKLLNSSRHLEEQLTHHKNQKAIPKILKQAIWRVGAASFLAVLSLAFNVLIPTDVAAATMGEHYLRGLLDMEKTSEFEKLSEDEQRFYIAANSGFRETLIYIGENIENLENNINEELFRAEEQG